MCDQTEINYLDGEVVWVKLGSCWWPGEVVGPEKLPSDVLPSFRKPPIAVVKFFQEDSYEYVKNINSIYKYNCSRKNEFINKGLYLYRTKHGQHSLMDKFPEDIIRAETAVGGDIEILTREEFQEAKKESYAGLFGDPAKKTPGSIKKGKNKGQSFDSPKNFTPVRKMREKSDYKMHILVQQSPLPTSKPTEAIPALSTSDGDGDTAVEDKCESVLLDNQNAENETPEKSQSLEKPESSTSTPTSASGTGIYACHACPFTTSRLNVLILHNKSHSGTSAYTPTPIKKKVSKSVAKPNTPSTSKISKTSRPRKEKTAKKSSPGQKRAIDDSELSTDNKKPKTEQEIKSSLLADWDDMDEDLNDEAAASAGSPEVPVAAESPAVPIPAELSSALVPDILSSPTGKKSNDEKSESASDSKYEFCEDEDWPLETDVGRKIPRVKNSLKRKDDTKRVSLEDEEVAREVAELLNKTTVPELPTVPESLKVEENFPEPSIVKSPDKQTECPDLSTVSDNSVSEKQPTKAIFKTKTFFRSRHSRSQDAIGKYVAEQLNAVERMDLSETEINGSEVVSSPEARESPPIEPVKIARLAPKIQLKKMKAEAAQLREKEKNDMDILQVRTPSSTNDNVSVDSFIMDPVSDSNENTNTVSSNMQDVLYPTQEIKPINEVIKRETKIILKNVGSANRSNEEKVTDVYNNTFLSEPTIDSPKEIEADSIRENINSCVNISDSASLEVKQILVHVSKKEEGFINESTASAVDTLLSVSRDSDRVTKNIGDDPPEDLFEDDKDNSGNINGFSENIVQESEVNSQAFQPSDLQHDNDQIQTNLSGCNLKSNNVPECKKDTNVLVESGIIESGMVQSGIVQSGIVQSGIVKSDIVKSGIVKSDVVDSDIVESGIVESDIVESGIVEPRIVESVQLDELETGINKSGIVETGLKELGIIDTGVVESEIVTAQEPIAENDPIESHSIETEIITESVESVPTESDLQIAEALINLPATASHTTQNEQLDIAHAITSISTENVIETENVVIDSMMNDTNAEITKTVKAHDQIVNDDSVNVRFETEQEKSENLNAAQSLVQMSESIDHTINIVESNILTATDAKPSTEPIIIQQNNGLDKTNTVEHKVASLSSDNSIDIPNSKSVKYETTSSKLLKILEEPCVPKVTKTIPAKQIIVKGKEKVLNFDVAKSAFKAKSQSPVIIRRATANKTLLNNMNDTITTPEKIILSRNTKSLHDPSSVQTYTIQTSSEVPSDSNNITIIQQKTRKVQKTPTKLQKIKPQNSLISPSSIRNKDVLTEDSVFDINSMPIVLSDDLLTPESIEKMPIVMSDGNLLTSTSNPPKLVNTKQSIIEIEKTVINTTINKPEVKTLLINPVSEVNKVTTTPNILSKSSKLRGAKPMLVIDKATGKQKIIMTKGDPPIKEIKSTPPLIQHTSQNPPKPEKFLLLPTASSARPGRTQKIVIDPQTGKAHVLVPKGPDTSMILNDNKPVSAKLIPSSSDASGAGNTVMIITNAQGAQSRIVLTSEHEKILFPNKQPQQNPSQGKAVTHRITTNPASAQKTIITSVPHTVTKTQTRLVPKQKSAIITSKGQLIVGGRVATTAQNIAPMPEIRPVPKRIIPTEPKKIVQTFQKKTSEPLIFLQQKSGTVVQLTASQFEHFQRTGQIIQKLPIPAENKPVIQKTITISPGDSVPSIVQKRIRKAASEIPIPPKKVKHEMPVASVLAPIAPMPPVPALTPLSNSVVTTVGPSISNTVSVTTTSSYPDLDNIEEMLPSTAIARQLDPTPAPAEPVAAPPAQLSDSQLLAVPGEHFGGPPGSFYLCVEDNGTFTPIDNRPLVLENNQLVPMALEPLPVLTPQPERRDILEAALANSDVFHAEPSRDEAPDFRDLNANVSVHCRVSETSSTLNQPIMTPVEMPTKVDIEPSVPANLEDGLAVIGVTPHTVPTSLELPITVTDPRIAPKTTDPLSGTNYSTLSLLPSPNTEMRYVTTEDVIIGGPISMPLLTDDDPVGKSMPILNDEMGDRGSQGSPMGSLGSLRDSPVGSQGSLGSREADDGPRRLLTPNSDMSETSSEIPLQPALQLSVTDITRHS